MRLYKRSTHLPAIQYIRSLELPDEEIVMLLYLSIITFDGSETTEVGTLIREVTDNMGDHYSWASRFRMQDLGLFKEDLIEFTFFEMGLDTDVSLTGVMGSSRW